MAIIRAKEMRDLGEQELTKRLDELRLELAKSRAQVAIGGAPQNPGRIKEIRRTIARALTIGREKRMKAHDNKKTGGGKK
ncbi:MAG: 50S ribosomal protein L29 [Candidatus Aenigmarchaeota archaeon]|nr:50S ribosomal protein L29 [Candidatus Aenigmarchaeota archaeon]